jgi:hypothetical protein
MRLEESQPKADLQFVFTSAQKALYFLASCRVLLDREECGNYPQPGDMPRAGWHSPARMLASVYQPFLPATPSIGRNPSIVR